MVNLSGFRLTPNLENLLRKIISLIKNPPCIGRWLNFFEAFLMLHPIPLIDSEGVLLRGRSYYKNRGYTKFESLVKNNRSSNTTTNKVFTNFFSILRISLESVLEKSIEFAWYYERASFKENLISLDEIFADTGV